MEDRMCRLDSPIVMDIKIIRIGRNWSMFDTSNMIELETASLEHEEQLSQNIAQIWMCTGRHLTTETKHEAMNNKEYSTLRDTVSPAKTEASRNANT